MDKLEASNEYNIPLCITVARCYQLLDDSAMMYTFLLKAQERERISRGVDHEAFQCCEESLKLLETARRENMSVQNMFIPVLA